MVKRSKEITGKQFVYWYCGQQGINFDAVIGLMTKAIDDQCGWGRGYAEIPGTKSRIYYDAGIDGWDSYYGIDGA